jgi:hypothetical protein
MSVFLAIMAASISLAPLKKTGENMVEVQLVGFQNMRVRCERKSDDGSFIDFIVVSNAKETAVTQKFEPQPNSQWPALPFERVGTAKMFRGSERIRVESQLLFLDKSIADSVDSVFEIDASMKTSKFTPKNEVQITRNGASIVVPCIAVAPADNRRRKGKKAK